MTIWLDMTYSLHGWEGGVVGIVRAELEFAKNLRMTEPDLRVCVCDGHAVYEVPASSLEWLWSAQNVADAYVERKRQGKFVELPAKSGTSPLSHPFAADDLLFSCGWILSGKEAVYASIKRQLPTLSLVYFVYDLIIVLPQTAHMYESAHEPFSEYLAWVSANADHVLFGGRTAQRDAGVYWEERGMRVPPGTPIKLGGDIGRHEEPPTIESVMRKYGFDRRYIIAVGSIEPRKNYETLVEAYAELLQTYRSKEIPSLVIVGGSFGTNVSSRVAVDPLLRARIHFARPTDAELDVLYENAYFSALPSLYEGWSLTLPEALGYGKFCVVSDVDPLREVGEDLVDYVPALDSHAWAQALRRYFTDASYVEERARGVQARWVPITWNDAAKQVLDALVAHVATR